MSGIPAEVRERLTKLRSEFERRATERAPAAWSRLAVETRCLLLMVAGVDAQGDSELYTLAIKDWREYAPGERAAIKTAADALRWQLNGARDLMC